MSDLSPAQTAILARIKDGPLPVSDYAGLAASRESLKVQVHRIRATGVQIETRRTLTPGKRGRPGAYVLVEAAQ